MQNGTGNKAAGSSPCLPPLAQTMKVDFLFNKDGGAWLFHDKTLPPQLVWAEFDADLGKLSLVTDSGMIAELGLDIPGAFGAGLHKAEEVIAIHVGPHGTVLAWNTIPIITRMTSVN